MWLDFHPFICNASVRSVSSRSLIFPLFPLYINRHQFKIFDSIFFFQFPTLVLLLFVSLSCALNIFISLYGLNLNFFRSFLLASLSRCRFSWLVSICRGVWVGCTACFIQAFWDLCMIVCGCECSVELAARVYI